jgi:hypothetical protein
MRRPMRGWRTSSGWRTCCRRDGGMGWGEAGARILFVVIKLACFAISPSVSAVHCACACIPSCVVCVPPFTASRNVLTNKSVNVILSIIDHTHTAGPYATTVTTTATAQVRPR